ncbi:hypothetical protein [Bacteroides oleiciplenus]|uniref:Uncharacterized protein n=1 Tax=Bacteroides oleiciplenus TaxID=626931 RepID=A0A3E5AYK7_9BACE|nr:hypothetical protein [Bacteroides oleiciplenus]RGN30332.1 hypothetical protein DXB65_22905 [Bacteroides oleiciplenus]
MKQKLLLGTIIVLLFGACGRSDVRLRCADEMIEQNRKDSASQILTGIKHPESFSKSNRALYALLAAEVACNEERLDEIDTLLTVALDYYRASTDSVHIVRTLFCAGQVARSLQCNEEAMKFFLEALPYTEGQFVSDYWRYVVNTWAGVVAAKERLFEDKICYSQKALNIARRMKNASYECLSLGDIAYGHLFSGRYDSALHYTEIMHEIVLRDSLISQLPYIYTRFQGIYTQKGEYALALKYVEKALRHRAPTDSANITGHYAEKAAMFGKLGQYDSAYHYFLKSEPCPDPFTQEARYYNMADTYYAMKRYKDAYECLLRYTQIDDSIKAAAKSSELIALQNLYQHERLRADNLRWRAQVAEHKHRVYWIIAVSVIVLWVAGGIYLIFYRRNRRHLIAQQKQLIGQQEQIISQQEELQLRNEEHLKNLQKINELQQKEGELKGAFFRQLNFSILQQVGEAGKNGNIIFSDKDWDVITENADAIFDNFTLRLRETYPGLNKEDLRYCCMVKMQLSQSEMAQIMHLEKDSVKKRLKRIRVDKIGTGSGITLEDLLRNF